MKVQEIMQKPLSEVLADMELTEMSPHTDEYGNIKVCVLKYTPKESLPKDTKGIFR